MKRTLAAFSAALFLASTACTVDLDVILFNSTGNVIYVLVGERKTEVLPLASASFKAGALYAGSVSILQGDAVYHYLLASPVRVPKTYYRSGGWAADIWMQLESDFRIYLIPISISEPGSPVSDQPLGFPVAPVPAPEHAA